MKLVINSTDFSTIGTALYFSNSNPNTKFLPSWIISGEETGTGFDYLGDLKMINDLENPLLYQNKYFSIDNLRYFAYPSPELFVENGQKTTNTPLNYSSVYYCGSKERLLDGDFAEYDFPFLVDKYKFNNNLKIQYLDRDSQDILGYDVSELTELENILFPTVYDTQTLPTQRNYFGMVSIGTYTLFVFMVPPNVRKIELYEGTVLGSRLSTIKTNYDYRIRSYSKYDPEKTYNKNNTVVYSGGTWKAKENGITGDWDETKWTFVNDFIQPSLSIYLGPDYLWSLCPNDWYQANPSTWGEAIRYIPQSKKYLHSLDEISSEKFLWMVITDSGEVADINLSYNIWKTSKINPERNKWKYALRNDEYWGTRSNLSILENRSKITLDCRSDTILSTDTVGEELQPILRRKLKGLGLLQYDETKIYNTGDKVRHQGRLWRAEEDGITGDWDETKWIEIVEYYSPFCTYRLGERVKYGSAVYESLCDLNLGNRPGLSSKWVLSENTTNFFTSRINIAINPSNAGRIVPGGQVRIDGSESDKYFTIYENLGYKLDPINTCSPRTGEYLVGTEILESDIQVEGGTMRKKIVVVPSTLFDTLIKSGNLIFNFNESPSKINLFGDYKGVLTGYSTSGFGWTYNNENIELIMSPPGSVDTSTNVIAGTDIILTTVISGTNTPIKNNKIKKAISRYTDKYGVTRIKDLKVEGNKIYDTVNFSTADYILYFGENTVMIDCIEGLKLFEMNDNRIEVPYMGDGIFRFYPRQETGNYLKVYVGENSCTHFRDNSNVTTPLPILSDVCSSCKVSSDGIAPDGRHRYKVVFTGLTGTALLKIEYE